MVILEALEQGPRNLIDSVLQMVGDMMVVIKVGLVQAWAEVAVVV